MGAFNQLNGAIFDAGAIEARISAVDGKSIYNQRDGGILDFDSLARRLTALDGKVAVGQGGIEFDVDTFMRRLAAIEAGLFTPASLFAAGEQGVWYDPSDFSTLFQDSAGTTPVTAVTQPVGKIIDKSGRGNHLTQTTTPSRPTVQQDASGFFYLNFDGVDDSLVSVSPVNLSGSQKGTLWAGANATSVGAYGGVFNLNGVVTTAGALLFWVRLGGALEDYLNGGGTAGTVTENGSPGARAFVHSVALDTSQGSVPTAIVSRINGSAEASTPTGGPTGSGNLGNGTLIVGSYNATNFLSGRLYQMFFRGGASSAAQIASGETFIGSKMGIPI